ncbi:per os infectivity factor pif-4 [Microplitis demolitor]|uniref:per os infectivity factor pif-4 (19kDa) n=1 Tax=Microplitis demolitor TaxID=69319 RepID=UPI00044002DA|nr:per os infectivity factor pif-4 (19kDa) [Microplitis demolitor]KAG6558399.1 per os infectivity factor pif-4 [Microplitis demolitor]
MAAEFMISFYLIIILSLCMKVILLKKSYASPEQVFDQISSSYNFRPTYLEIYDQSIKSKCDRLIVIRPFDWSFWAINGYCYVLNSLKAFDCPKKMTPTLIIDAITVKEKFLSPTCYPIDYSIVFNEYKSHGPPIINYFNIEDVMRLGKFTIVDALNYLFKYYIEIDLDEGNAHPLNKKIAKSFTKKRNFINYEDAKKVKEHILEHSIKEEQELKNKRLNASR